jgi:hypothetical protein
VFSPNLDGEVARAAGDPDRHDLSLPPNSRPERGKIRNITTVPRGEARVVIRTRNDELCEQ